MKCTLKTQKHGEVNFWTTNKSGGLLMTDINDSGGNQVCHGGQLSGVAMSYHGPNSGLNDVCKRWMLAYNRNA